ncbi:hypothetical protein ACN28S_57090 [Cystobacter fuscus]
MAQERAHALGPRGMHGRGEGRWLTRNARASSAGSVTAGEVVFGTGRHPTVTGTSKASHALTLNLAAASGTWRTPAPTSTRPPRSPVPGRSP